jgi:photosystem II stability/assembly factor-like uncharacterized protein
MTARTAAVLVALACCGAAPPPGPPSEPLPGLAARPIGPATMGGRITSVAVVESQPATQYVGAASGGLWKTSDEGLSWVPVFEGRPHPSVGAVAVAPSDPSVVWLGTGEANARNSVCWGNGVYVSHDAGKTWRHAGLAETHHVGRIVVHPHDPDHAYVAALGRLWGPNRERGVFRTRDGGRTWEHVLALDAETGCVDLAIDPADPRTLYAAAYRVRRGLFSGGNPEIQFGPKAGIYKTIDDGKTWKRLTVGLPTRPLGRIGLAVWRRDPRVLYAVVQSDRTDARHIAGQPQGNSAAVETGGLFRSDDRGDRWRKVNDLCPRPFYYGQVRIEPGDDQRIYVLGVQMHLSRDGGRTFNAQAARGAHVDHHDLWIDPADPRRLVLAGDGGLYYSRDRSGSWLAVRNLPIGQYYGAAVDQRTPYRIYGGMQDNGTWGGPSRTDSPSGILNAQWKRNLAFDGFRCAVPPDDLLTVYAEGQYGRLHRIELHPIELTTRRALPIRPPNRARGPAFRFNWSSPMLLSAHNTKTLYFGGNHLFKTTTQGRTWYVLGPDLTRGEPGASAEGGHTLSAIAESPRKAGLLYTGSDDGRVHVSNDDGEHWKEVATDLPGGVPPARWITHLECSPHATGTVWLAIDRHRQDDRAPYLFRSDDTGATWKSLSANLPAEGPVHVVRADPRNPDLLYVGTEFGLFVSLDAGATWQPLGAGLPPVPVHDLVLHPRDRELVVVTHGRSLYIIDAAPLQELTPAVRATRAYLFPVRGGAVRRPRPALPPPSRTYAGANPPEGMVLYYRLARAEPAVSLEVLSPEGDVVSKLAAPRERGLHAVVWKPAKVSAGEYTVRLRAAGLSLTRTLRFGPAE